jgi:spore germination cell wall hydrolase CwlJ-like protein
VTRLLRQLARPEHRLWLATTVLALVGLAIAGLTSPGPGRGPARNSHSSGDPQADIAQLISLTADPRSTISEAEAARAANQALPLLAGALQRADPFGLPAQIDPGVADRARECLALAMYHEAGFEGAEGRLAVAQVVLNRVRHPAFPHDVCSVVFQRSANNICQFTFACDGALLRPRQPGLWQQTLGEAEAVLRGLVFGAVGMATHYHADYVFPAWAPRLDKIAVIGTHVFYRWPDGWGLRRAFTAAYTGAEPALSELEIASDPAEPAPLAIPSDLAAAAGEVAPIRSANEGGFIDPTKGWVPGIARPTQSPGSPEPAPDPTSQPTGSPLP